ncbi:MAG: ABC transporter substrate-binding protein [Coriobacteriales bacterium]|jgi:peptide/nickel transport system substrate-binding protein|nr:ABC transporter substrate-binding protein [Coriobacteriales bacterium]
MHKLTTNSPTENGQIANNLAKGYLAVDNQTTNNHGTTSKAASKATSKATSKAASNLSRRDILKLALGGASLLALGTGLVSCSAPGASDGINSGASNNNTGTDGSADNAYSGGDSSSQQKYSLVIGQATEPRSLDPAYNYETATFTTTNNIYESILHYTPDLKLEPGIAKSWQAIDSTTYVYEIRDDVTFSDGSKLTVEDVIYSLERIRNPEVATNTSWMLDSVDTILKTGEWQITVHLNTPDATWQYVPATSAGQVISKKFTEAQGKNYGQPDGQTLGSGPYKLSSWTQGSELVFTRNENYWNSEREIVIDEVTVQIIPDDNARALAAQSGQLDFVIGPTADLIDQYLASGRLKLSNTPALQHLFISFNTQRAPFNDKNVRIAVSHAIDAQGIRENTVGDYAQDAGALPFSSEGYVIGKPSQWQTYNTSLPVYDYDVKKAEDALAKSAYPDGFKTSLIVRPGTNDIAQAIQANLKAINIEVELLTVTNEEYYAYVYGSKFDSDGIRDYDFSINRWVPDFPDPVGILQPMYWSKNIGAGGTNFASYSNPTVDDLILKQQASTDNDERTELIQEAFAIAAEEAPYKILQYNNNLTVLNAKYEYQLSALWLFSFSPADFKLAD